MAQHTIDIEQGGLLLTTGRELSEAEQQRVAEVVANELFRLDRLAETAIHPVHYGAAYEITEDEYEGKLLVSRGGRALRDEFQACPDCGRSVIGGNSPSVAFDFLACPSIPPGPLDKADRPCHEGCLVACGVPK